MVPKALANAILTVVTIVWAGNFAASVFVPSYHSDASINFVFATVVGGALALKSDPGHGFLARVSAVLRPPPPPPVPPATAPGREEEVPR